MNTHIEHFTSGVRRIERETQAWLANARCALALWSSAGYPLRHANRKPLASYVLRARPMVVLTAPLIYSMIVPFLLLDLFISIYQRICFAVYGIARANRADYFIFDRERLPYLNLLEKINCLYCSYANGLIGYVREIAARTEQYWCPIKHAKTMHHPHDRYQHFSDYEEASFYHARTEQLRRELAERSSE